MFDFIWFLFVFIHIIDICGKCPLLIDFVSYHHLLVTNNFKHFTKEDCHMKKFKTVCLASLISLLGITAIFSTIKPTSGNASTPTTQEETTAAERPLSDKPGKDGQ